MGLFSKITDTLFGGTDDSAQRETIEQNRIAREFAKEQGSLARNDALSLYPAADRTRNDSYQLAMALMGQLAPQQMQTFQDGNLGAQSALIGGQSRFRNAILGMPDNSGPRRPVRLSLPEPSMFDVQPAPYEPRPMINVPYTGDGTLPAEAGASQQPALINLAQFLGGNFR